MFIKIILILLICDKVHGLNVDEAVHYAACISQCDDKSCRDECIGNEYLREKMEISTEIAGFNATLHCRDVDLMTIKHNPGIYVIEMGNSDKWEDAIVKQGDTSIFTNLKPGESYRYRVRRIRKNIISSTEITPWFTTKTFDVKPEPVKSIYVKDISPDNTNDLMAEIAFVPAEDRSCFYNVLSWSDDEGLSIGGVNATRGFHFNLHHLPYYRNTTVVIIASNHENSMNSSNKTLSFMTPSCAAIHKNLTKCPPDQITGLRVTAAQNYVTNYDIMITWDKPRILPDNYSIEIVTLDETIDPYFINIPGNSTKFLYSSKKGLRHKISIVAESPGGISIPVSIYNTQKPNIHKSTPALNKTVIIFSSIALTAVLIIIVYIYCRCKKLKKFEKPFEYNPTESHEKAIFNPIYEKSKYFQIEKKEDEKSLIPKDCFEIKPMQLKIKDILGSGFSGIVRLGSLKIDENESIDVAVKMLRDCPSTEDINNFQHEIMIMKSAGKHRNIVSIIGCCSSITRPMLVVEYCSKGDLQTYLRNIWENIMNNPISQKFNFNGLNKKNGVNYENHREIAVSNQLYDVQPDMLSITEDITVADLLSFSVQIANGMEFLSSNRIVHRDLAARNILVCGDGTVKISDFGLSRDIYQENIYKKQGDGKLPLKWMAIEALTHQIYTTQSDVWSFGILLWEIVTLGCNPYPDTPTNMILQVLKTGYRMERPPSCGEELYDIMLSCWRTSPRSRPTFTELKHSLDKLLQSVSKHEYLNLCTTPTKLNSSD